MGSLFGAKPKGPSLADKTRDYYSQVAQARAAAGSVATPAVQQQQAQQTAQIQSTDPEKLKVAGGGFFGSPGTFLGGSGSGSRSTFLGS